MSHICYDWPGLLDSGSKRPTLSNSRFLEKYNFSQITGWAYLTRSFKSIAFLLGEKKKKNQFALMSQSYLQNGPFRPLGQ